MPKRISKSKRLEQQINDLKGALWMESALKTNIAKERDQLVDIIDRITRIVGKNSILLPPKTRSGPLMHQAPIMSDLPTWSPQMMTVERKIQTMHSLISKAAFDSYKSSIHFRVKMDNDGIAYQISDQALMGLTKDELYHTIVPEVAQQISYELATCLKRF